MKKFNALPTIFLVTWLNLVVNVANAQVVPVDCGPPAGGYVTGSPPAVRVVEYDPLRLSVYYSSATGGLVFDKFDVSISLANQWIIVRPHRASYKPPATENTGVPPGSPAQEILIPGLPAGTYQVRFEDGDGRAVGQLGDTRCRQFKVSATGTPIRAQTLVQGDLLRYFLTASQADVDALLALTPNRAEWAFPLWQRTEPGFWVWPIAGDWPATTKPVCRLFNSKASSHFYSANSNDCATLANLPDWRDEGVAFRALVPEGGVCGFGTVPVYRLFNTSRSNHRYTTNVETYRYAQGKDGWVGEGVAFCSPPL